MQRGIATLDGHFVELLLALELFFRFQLTIAISLLIMLGLRGQPFHFCGKGGGVEKISL